MDQRSRGQPSRRGYNSRPIYPAHIPAPVDDLGAVFHDARNTALFSNPQLGGSGNASGSQARYNSSQALHRPLPHLPHPPYYSPDQVINPASLAFIPNVPWQQGANQPLTTLPSHAPSATFFPAGFSSSPVASVSGDSSLTETDEQSDAITEDKRRRNTAASARFRHKKKQATLNLERSVSDLSNRAAELEREAADLRMENGWLKELAILKGNKEGVLARGNKNDQTGRGADSKGEVSGSTAMSKESG